MFQRCYLLFLPLSLTLTHAYSQAGMLDSTFGNHGIVITDIYDSDDLYAMAIQPDQKILAAGSVGGLPGIGSLDLAIVRYMPDGSQDPDFGDGGIVRIDYDGTFYRCHAMAVQPDGQIVLAGLINYEDVINKYDVDDFAVIRLNTNGSLDSTFGNAGIVITDMGGELEWANEVLIQEDGKIIAAGQSIHSAGFIMVRYESNGKIDTSFGNEGFVRTSIHKHAEVRTGVIQPDGKIILAGYASSGPQTDFGMVRYLQNGTLDSLFGVNGIVQTDLEGNHMSDLPNTIVLEPGGKIVLAGFANYISDFSKSDIGVVRYKPDGSLDLSFGNNGIDIIYLGSKSQIHGIVRQPDGKYVLTGNSNVIDSTQNWLLVRLDYNGELDTTFGNQGIVLTDIEGEQEYSLKILLQNNGRIVVGGSNHGGFDLSPDFVLARYIVDNQTGIQIINPLSISISPNPCTDFISVDIEDQSASFNCIISDLAGRIIRNETLYPGSDGKMMIDTRLLPTGFYLLRIKDNVKSGVVSFVVEK